MKNNTKFANLYQKAIKRELKTNSGAPAGITMSNAKMAAEEQYMAGAMKVLKRAAFKSRMKTQFTATSMLMKKLFRMGTVLVAEMVRILLRITGFAAATATAYILATMLYAAFPIVISNVEQALAELLNTITTANGGTVTNYISELATYWQNLTLNLPHANLSVVLGAFTIPAQCLLWFRLFRLNRRFPVADIWKKEIHEIISKEAHAQEKERIMAAMAAQQNK